MLLCPLSEGSASAGLVHHGDHHAQQHEEYQNAQVVCVRYRSDKPAGEHPVHRILQPEVVQQQRTGQDSDKQRRINLLRQQCEQNCDDRRNQRPECIDKAVCLCNFFTRFRGFFRDRRNQNRRCNQKQRRNQKKPPFVAHKTTPVFCFQDFLPLFYFLGTLYTSFFVVLFRLL